MSTRSWLKRAFRGSLVVLLARSPVLPAGEPVAHQPAEILGVWRGTSMCTDRVAAPACHDEVVIYEFQAGTRAGALNWKADKIVGGERLRMGELEIEYAASDGCWRAEFGSPHPQVVWCLTVDHDHMTGRAWLLPRHEVVRKVDARRD